MTRAIVHVPNEEYEADADLCMQYIEEHGYEFVGLVRGDWDNVKSVFDRDGASVAIVASEEYLDPHRKGRVEVVANQPAPGRWERTRIIRRNAAE